jgi:hypothetical protein
MAYRQYFPALSVAEGGRPYSIAEFATEKDERPIAPYTSGSPERDLEMGGPRQSSREQGISGSQRWDGGETAAEVDLGRVSRMKLHDNEHEYGTVATEQQPVVSTSFEEDTEYGRR